MLDMSSLVECSNLGHQHPKLVAAIKAQADRLAFVTQRLGRRAAPRAGRAPARGVRIRGRARLLHAGRRGCQRERRAHRAAGLEEAARPRRHARPLLSRRELHGHGAVGRLPAPRTRWTPRPGACATCRRRIPTAARSAARTRTTAASARLDAVAAVHRRGRRGPRRRRPDGNGCRQQRHRAAGQLLAGAARVTREREVLPDRRRSDERLRPLRRVVRLAAPWRGGPPRPHDARQGAHGRRRPARRRRDERRRRAADRARDVLRRPHVLRPPALLRRRRRRDRRLSRRKADRPLAHASARRCSRNCRSSPPAIP